VGYFFARSIQRRCLNASWAVLQACEAGSISVLLLLLLMLECH
jgi:hypothetical protein